MATAKKKKSKSNVIDDPTQTLQGKWSGSARARRAVTTSGARCSGSARHREGTMSQVWVSTITS